MSWQLLLAVLILFNSVASVAIARCFLFSPTQKWLQHALVWLLPFVGAVICLVFVSSQAREAPDDTGTFDPLHSPSDAQMPSQGEPLNICGCGGGAGAVDGGGD